MKTLVDSIRQVVKRGIINMLDKQRYTMSPSQIRFWARLVNDGAQAHQSYTGYHRTEFPYTLIPHVYDKTLLITPLSAMFVLGREQMFVHHFDTIYPLELKLLRRLPKDTKTLWSQVIAAPVKYHSYIRHVCWYIRVLCRLHYFFSAFGGRRLLNTIHYPFTTFSHVTYMEFYRQLTLFYHQRRTDYRSLQKRLYLPVLTLDDIPKPRLAPFLAYLKTLSDGRLYTAVVQQLYNSAPDFKFHKSTDLRKYAQTQLTQHMVRVVDRQRSNRVATYTKVTNACVYLLNRATHVKGITAIANTCQVIYNIEAGRQLYSCVVSDGPEYFNTPLLFIRYNTRFVEGKSHPFLYNLVRKFRGRVPRLSFHSSLNSDGILLPWQNVKCFFPQIPADTTEHDITHYFFVHRLLRPKPAPKRWPFMNSPYLRQSHIRIFAHDYLTWNESKRALFCRMFFDTELDDHMLNTEACGNFVVKVLQRLEQRRHLRSFMSFEFWERFTRIQERFSERLQVMYLLGTSATTPLAVLFEEQHNWTPSKIGHYLSVADMLNVQLSAFMLNIRVPGVVRQAKRLHAISNLPGTLRRVIWHTSLPLLLDDGSNIESISLPQPVSTPATQIPIIEPENAVVFRVNRDTCIIDNFVSLNRLDDVTLMFSGEPGTGQGVYKDILATVWKKAIDTKLLTWHGDTLFINTAAPFSPNTCQQLQHLGIISALSILRGFYLPYPLHPCWWTHVLRGADNAMSMSAFDSMVATYVHTLSLTSDPDVADILGLNLEQVQNVPREELIKKHYIPDMTYFYNFCMGFSMVFPNPRITMKLATWPGIDLNQVLVDPKPHLITAKSFEQFFQVQHDKDRIFLQLVQTLDTQQLQRLIHFITGRDRLPLEQIGEQLMTITWTSHGNLPTSHNCTNTLYLNITNIHTVQDMRKYCQVIFDYNTVYGSE